MKLSDIEVASRLSDRGFCLLTPFVSTKRHAMLRCQLGHEWSAYMASVLKKNGTGCPHCAGRADLTLSEIDRRLSGRGFTRLCTNTVSARKSEFMCDAGHKWSACLGQVLHGNGCPQCSSSRALTSSEVNARIFNRGLRVIDSVVSTVNKALFKCANGHVWSAKPGNVLAGKGCPQCYEAGNRIRHNIHEALEGRGISVVGDVKNANTVCCFRCDCGYEWNTVPSSVLRGSGCPKCAHYGFNPLKPAYFYTLQLFSSRGDYVGFGVTNNITKRMYTHAHNLRMSGFTWNNLWSCRFDSGAEAKQLENLVKSNVGVVNTGVTGFKTEAVPFCKQEHLQTVIRGFV